jgi:hypothetical protein
LETGSETMTQHYEITIKEQLEETWSVWFDGLTVTPAPDGGTVLSGAVRDQTALHGLLAKIRDLGLTLVTVASDPPAAP